MKVDVIKKDEELDILRRNIKNSKYVEIEVENKAYKDECSRLRNMLEDLMNNGQSHPIYA